MIKIAVTEDVEKSARAELMKRLNEYPGLMMACNSLLKRIKRREFDASMVLEGPISSLMSFAEALVLK